MKFGDFLFPESRDPAADGQVIEETLAEAGLADRLGIDAVWLAEHHFDGICAYVDPIGFAAALAVATRRARIGFAVLQASLHHPVRLAEQLSLIDHLSRGRLIVGLGRGTAYNIYDYQGYGIDPEEAEARLEEAESIMLAAWSQEGFRHQGRFWTLDVPALRPRPYSRPYPFLIRAASGETSMIAAARRGQPFLMNVQSNATTARRMDLYRRTLAEAGYDEAAIAEKVEQCWIWRNVFVAETDARAEKLGIPAFIAMQEHRAALRERIFREQGKRLWPNDPGPAARTDPTHALIAGSPETVAEAIAAIARIGVGGIIMAFRLGPMPHAVAAESLTLFVEQVAPQFSPALQAGR